MLCPPAPIPGLAALKKSMGFRPPGKGPARRVFEQGIKRGEAVSRHACGLSPFQRFLAHQGQRIKGVLPGYRRHKASVTHQGCAQCFIDRSGVPEPGFVWLHWNASTRRWDNQPAIPSAAVQGAR